MPVRSQAQYRFARAARARGEKWAQSDEWFAVDYDKLPKTASPADPRKDKKLTRLAAFIGTLRNSFSLRRRK